MGQSKNLLLLLNIKFYIENVLSVPSDERHMFKQ